MAIQTRAGLSRDTSGGPGLQVMAGTGGGAGPRRTSDTSRQVTRSLNGRKKCLLPCKTDKQHQSLAVRLGTWGRNPGLCIIFHTPLHAQRQSCTGINTLIQSIDCTSKYVPANTRVFSYILVFTSIYKFRKKCKLMRIYIPGTT